MTAPAPPSRRAGGAPGAGEAGLEVSGPGVSGPGVSGPEASGMAAMTPHSPAAAAWRQWRWPLVLVAVILLGGVLVAMLRTTTRPVGALDPRGTGPSGAHALADILAQRGYSVTRAGTVGSALAAAQAGGATLLVTNTGRLDRRQLTALSRSHDDLVVVAPGPAALATLAPAVTMAGVRPVSPATPGCSLRAAQLAGIAEMGGAGLHPAVPGAQACYWVDGQPSLVRYSAQGRTITVLGTGTPLANADLAVGGNAALALNLLGGKPGVVWLVPGPPEARPAAAGGPRSLTSLLPPAVYLVVIELAVAVLLAALWRMRRLGPLVAEQLPVVVRASETVEGHGRLYRSRRARDRVASALRSAALQRIESRLALPHGAPPDAVCQVLAARTGRDPAAVRAVIYGPAPSDDAALIALTAELDALEGEVLTQ